MNDFGLLVKFHRLLVPFLGAFLATILFDAVATALLVLLPLLARVLLDNAYPFRNLSLLNLTILTSVAACALYFLLSAASEFLKASIDSESKATLTTRVFRALTHLPLAFHQQHPSSDLMAHITDDVDVTTNMVQRALPTLLIGGGRLALILMVVLSIDAKLALVTVISIPLFILEARFQADRSSGRARETLDAQTDLSCRARERLENIRPVKAFGQERVETRGFAQWLHRRDRMTFTENLIDTARFFSHSIMLQVWGILLIWIVGQQVVRGHLTIGESVSLLLLVILMVSPMRSIIELLHNGKNRLASICRIERVLNESSEEENAAEKSPLKIADGVIAAERISFSYEPSQEVLHNIDLRFAPRSITAIVGDSGSGKTTLANLLLRFLHPTTGAIFVDGQDISQVRLHDLRDRVGIVERNMALFDATVMDNILYGNEEKSRGDAMQAAMLAGAHDFIETLPGKYDTTVGPCGSLLSNGQCRRILMARTLLRDPKVIIFDEAGGDLDAESEFHIQEMLTKLRRSKTIIVIARRLSTIKTADAILMLEEGRLVEQGPFDKLIAERGDFYRFFWRQFGGLATFRRHLGLELERTARYGSRFCLAVLKIAAFAHVTETQGPGTAEQLMEDVDLLVKKTVRMGDDCARLDRNLILILLPEIDTEQLAAFFERMRRVLAETDIALLGAPLPIEELHFVGTRITGKHFRTPEELLQALTEQADAMPADATMQIFDEEELAQSTAAEGGRPT